MSIAQIRITPRCCRTATTAPRSTYRGGGSLGSAVAVATCPRRQCRFSGAGCTSIASTPTRQSRRSWACQVRPTCLCCRWEAHQHRQLKANVNVFRGKNISSPTTSRYWLPFLLIVLPQKTVLDMTVRIIASAFPLRETAAGFLVIFSSMEWLFACFYHRLFKPSFIIASCLKSTVFLWCVQYFTTRGRTQGGF